MKDFFEKMGGFIGRKYLLILIICLALIVPAVFGAAQIENKAPDKTIMVSHGSQEYKDYTRFADNFSETVILLLLTADNMQDLVQRDNILALDSFEQQMASQPHVAAVIGPAFMIKFAMAPPMGAESVPDDDETILNMVRDPETGAIRTDFIRLFPDERHALATIIVEAGIEDEDLFDLVDATEATASGIGFKSATYTVTGLPVHKYETSDKMVDALQMMIGVTLILMLIILILVHKVRHFFTWRWFPLGVVFLGIFYTFAVMGLTDIPITPVTVGAFPILIGLGVGITIQFHDRYDKAMLRGESPAKAVIEAITCIGPATGIAAMVVCLGFAALATSAVPMIVDFGYSLIIGTIVMYLLAVFMLVPVLYWNDRRHEGKALNTETAIPRDGFVERGLRKLSPKVVKQPVITILLAIILGVCGYILDSGIDAQPDPLGYTDDDFESAQNLMLLQELTGARQSASILIEADSVIEPQVLNWMLALQDRIETNEPNLVGTIESITDIILQAPGGQIPEDPASTEQIVSMVPRPLTLNMITDDRTAANITLNLPGLNADDLRGFKNRVTEYISDAPEGVTVAVTGSTIIRDKMSSGLTGGREKMTLIGIGLAFAGLVLFFRFNIKRAVVAALPTIFIIGWAAIVVYLLGIEYTPLGATRAAMGMGIGLIFTVLLMNRYYEERDKEQSPVEAITSALVGVGRPIIACGLTVIGGFVSLLMATDFPLLTDFGVITLVTVFFGLVSTIIVLPPMIVLADSWFGNHKPRKREVRVISN